MSMLQMWVDVQLGSHVPYFPGVNWEEAKKDRYKELSVFVAQRNRASGEKTRSAIYSVMTESRGYKSSEITKKTGMKYNVIRNMLYSLEIDGVVYRKQVSGKFGPENLWFMK